MKTRIWVRALKNRNGAWVTSVKVQRHTEDGRLPHFKTELFYTFGAELTKAGALKAGRSDARRLKKYMAQTGIVPPRRL